jgi:quercetin dioxygenase-like cupin family protein
MTISKAHWLTAVVCSSFIGLLVAAAVAQSPPMESKGQKAAELCAIDLSGEIASVQGRRLRMRLVTVEPGGTVALHGHQDRPTLMHVTNGTLLSHWGGKPDRTLGPGDCVSEGKDITQHWMENKGTEPAKYIAVDVTK